MVGKTEGNAFEARHTTGRQSITMFIICGFEILIAVATFSDALQLADCFPFPA
jgi:hypothetical protein